MKTALKNTSLRFILKAFVWPAIACAAATFAVVPMEGAIVIDKYDYSYTGSLLPDAASNPIIYTGTGVGSNTKFSQNYKANPSSAALSAPTLTITSAGTGGVSTDSQLSYYVNSSQNATWTTWGEEVGSVIEITAKVTLQVAGSNYAQGFRLINVVGSSRMGYFFYLGDGFIGFGDDLTGANMTKYLMDTKTSLQTYQLVLTSEGADVYLNGSSNPVLTIAQQRATSANSVRLDFGDFSTTTGGGTVAYTSIRWANSVSIIPEPGSVALIGLGSIGFGLLARRRRCTN